MQLDETQERPYEVLASDLFELNNKMYVVLVDYYSKYFEDTSTHIPDGSSATVIQILKQYFARHGIPERLRTYNGPEYSSLDFKQFMNMYGVNRVTSLQSNGMAERTVQTVKKLSKKQRRTEIQN